MWKLIPKTDYYECSDRGEFRSVTHTTPTKTGYMKEWPGRNLKVSIDGNGYGVINLKVGKDRKIFRAHRVIWETFNGPIPDGMTVDHIDEDKTNNALSNLQLMSAGQNAAKSALGGGKKRRGLAKLYGAEMVRMSNVGKTYREIAKKFDCSVSYVEKICTGKRGQLAEKRTRSHQRSDVDDIVKLEADGVSYDEIARRYGINASYARMLCNAHRKESPRLKVSMDDVATIKRMRAEGKKVGEIAVLFKCSGAYISSILNGKRKNLATSN